jgi:HAD superfamily hydrolase (TIGR01509 family)
MDHPYIISRERFVLPEREFAAYIFDCDGTLVDSMPLHLKAWRIALEKNGFDPELFTLEMHHRFAGMPGPAIVRDLNDRFGAALDPEQTERDKVEWYLAHHHEVTAVRPVAEFAAACAGRLPMAVASGSDARLVHDSLRAIGLHEIFATVVTPEQVRRGKPAPDMFLLCAERMGVGPADCLVFEDGGLGMEAAAAAGMHAVFITADAGGM